MSYQLIEEKMDARIIPQIDWNELQYHLGTTEHDPEGLVHELAHAYDCIGKKAFDQPIGMQNQVSKLIKRKYQRKWYADLSEVRVSAITYLVVEPLGHAQLHNMVANMYGNVSGTSLAIHYGKDGLNNLFLRFLNDPKIKTTANNIRDFILKFERKSDG